MHLNGARARCWLALLLLSAIGFGPISITALIGITVVLKRPAWFLRLVLDVYAEKPGALATTEKSLLPPSRGTRLRVLAALAALLILDIAPFPVVGSIGLWIVSTRPLGFLLLVKRIYGIDPISPRKSLGQPDRTVGAPRQKNANDHLASK